jgi:hypothetical protein
VVHHVCAIRSAPGEVVLIVEALKQQMVSVTSLGARVAKIQERMRRMRGHERGKRKGGRLAGDDVAARADSEEISKIQSRQEK